MAEGESSKRAGSGRKRRRRVEAKKTEPGAGSREPGAGSREPGTGNRFSRQNVWGRKVSLLAMFVCLGGHEAKCLTKVLT